MNSSVVRLAQAKVDQDVVEISLTDTQILGCYPVFFEPWQHGGEESLQYFKRLWVMWVDVQTSFCPAYGRPKAAVFRVMRRARSDTSDSVQPARIRVPPVASPPTRLWMTRKPRVPVTGSVHICSCMAGPSMMPEEAE